MKIVLIGAGNVATQLGIALKEKNFQVIQVYSRTLSNAEMLGKKLQTDFTSRLQEITTQADLYIFAVKDAALSPVLKVFPPTKGLWVHTAGSLPMDIFKDSSASRYGVFYPLQTFSKNRKISFEHIPVFLEANDPKDEQLLEKIALSLSDKVIRLSSEKRKYLHLAAVFACNFTNHLYDIAAQLLENLEIDWKVLLPLIEETAGKVQELSPREAQTGPAVRHDVPVIEKQMEMLKGDPGKQNIYRILSRDICPADDNVFI
ncbi:MAG: DUF2520 domain-containing protein [Dysgonamonadaceae bacterium]|nr:DUF2520 domain-containing protein [Dysgonamonadaceae bacterium]